MAYTDYQKALKIGEKTYKTCVANGSYPYLPVLEDMLSREKPCSQVRLGLVDIPIELIAGTYTAGRTTAFSYDFMPLLDGDTEFAYKWAQLCDSLTADGQRDPIVAFEYMNRYYVVEGNKRVSVQKFLGAASVEGIVTRMIPPRTDAKGNRVYYEYLDFYAVTKINYVLMSNEGSYEKLLHLIHPNADEPFSEDESQNFKFLFSTFRKEYEDKGGKKLISTIGDALLTYISIFGYDDVKNKTAVEVRKDIAKIWSELILIADEKPFSLITDPSEEQQNLLSRLIPAGNSVLKVAFVHYKEPEISGWSYCHELGKDHVEKVFGERISVRSVSTYDSSDIGLLEKLIGEGFKLIFTTTPVLSDISLKCAVLHPEVIILNCSLNSAYRHLRTYYLRIYEAKFIVGAVAGIMTQTDKIGYIADYPIFGMPASVDAFALGVKLVNPRAKVYLDWSTLTGNDPITNMAANGVDIVSNRDMTVPVQESREFGLYGITGDSRYNIAMPVWNWGIMYESLVRSVLKGTWKNYEDGKHGLNYYWGMSSGAIDVIFSQRIPSGTRQLIWILMNQIRSGAFCPFSSEIFDQDGVKRNEDANPMTPEEIINIDWLTDNIIGRIPDIGDLDERCHELIQQLGVKREQQGGWRMRILTLADEECKYYWDHYKSGMFDEFDLIIACGDLSPHYLSFIATFAHAPIFYVNGNHDGKEGMPEPEGCFSLEDDIVEFQGVRILGLGGSMRYRQGKNMYTEKEMRHRVRKLALKLWKHKGFDILVTHAPAYQLGDGDDLPHRGFQVFVELLDKYSPKYFIHGHVHLNYGSKYKRVSQYKETTIINAYEKYVFEY